VSLPLLLALLKQLFAFVCIPSCLKSILGLKIDVEISYLELEHTMDFVFILYILFSVVVGVGGTYMLIQTERTLAGFLYFVGSILILTFYGLRWFTGNALQVSRYDSKTWPPVVNTCPDFLSLTERTAPGTSRKEKVCVDLIGVAEGGIQKLSDPASLINDTYVFKLYETDKGAARMRKLCEECKAKKVTWEGVYDGVSCVATGAVPNSDGSADTSNGEDCN